MDTAMSVEITWYGHATWMIQAGEHKILLDPFFDDNPSSPVKADEVSADTILVSHGHFDHIADVASIARRTGAKVVAIYEIVEWLTANHDLQNTVGMNIGGQTELPWGSAKLVYAQHSSALPDGSYGGSAAGFVLTIAGKKIYFACDTGLFGDMKLIGDAGIDLAVLPIGDLFTMGPEDSVLAAKLINAKKVLPTHYNTWPPIEQDASKWAEQMNAAGFESIVLQTGETFSL